MIRKGQTTVNISFGVLKAARQVAEDEHRSLSSLIEACLVREIERHKRLKAIDAEIAREEQQIRKRAMTKKPAAAEAPQRRRATAKASRKA